MSRKNESKKAEAKQAEEGTRMKCGSCGYVWTYRGQSTYYACCPRCHSSVNIKRGHIEEKN